MTASCQVFPRVGPGGGWLDGGGGLFSPALELPLGPQHQTLGRLWSAHLPWSYFHSPKRSTLWAGGPGARWSWMSIYCSDFPAQESPSRVGCDPGSDPGHPPCVASRGFLPLWLQSPQRRRGRSQQWQPPDLVKRMGGGGVARYIQQVLWGPLSTSPWRAVGVGGGDAAPLPPTLLCPAAPPVLSCLPKDEVSPTEHLL